MNIHMVTVVGNHLTMFDHMLRHYRDMGVDSLLVNVHLERYGDPLYEDIRVVSRRYHAEIVSVFVGNWLQSVNPYLYRHTMQQAPGDWFLLADTDEFQVYPRDVRATLRVVEEMGFDFVEGFFIDRVDKNGALPDVKSDTRPWEQFPLAGLMTFPLLRGNILKVVAAKGSIGIAPGQHYAYKGSGCAREDCFIPVHHFKWTGGLLERLRRRAAFYRSIGDDLWQESERFISYFETNGGKIDVSDFRFNLQESGTVCGHENELKAKVLADADLMPRPCPEVPGLVSVRTGRYQSWREWMKHLYSRGTRTKLLAGLADNGSHNELSRGTSRTNNTVRREL
jgi:hypothetical protein